MEDWIFDHIFGNNFPARLFTTALLFEHGFAIEHILGTILLTPLLNTLTENLSDLVRMSGRTMESNATRNRKLWRAITDRFLTFLFFLFLFYRSFCISSMTLN